MHTCTYFLNNPSQRINVLIRQVTYLYNVKMDHKISGFNTIQNQQVLFSYQREMHDFMF